ncbi:GNAT family N-acetyltransferase [Herbivorax sp. ANBcel31]|uniref:GNAT family N-acetyltransferase n=1 Tax=Herbivorax sp. ANBcel31 TaxID=3069754 RepID=UPI0027B2858D|nr:GNAT family N-acetyltransferase [Herbivorax sp. ANBcel31]MDQ2087956.1 GNAT family N-acetyltransferase [Herbivorax sp. ANBcel31]
MELYKDYDTNPVFEKMEKISLKIQKHYYYKILVDDKILGGIHAYKKSDSIYCLNRIYVRPDYENLGIGKMAMEFIEKEITDADIWTLETPHKSYKNHHFYEKLGYKRTGNIEDFSENLKLIHYKKTVAKAI